MQLKKINIHVVNRESLARSLGHHISVTDDGDVTGDVLRDSSCTTATSKKINQRHINARFPTEGEMQHYELIQDRCVLNWLLI